MTKIENDLDKSKSIREKQAKEFNKQIDHLKSEHKKEVRIRLFCFICFWSS